MGDWLAFTPTWLAVAPEALEDAAVAAVRTADRLVVVRARLRFLLGDSAAALGWSGEAASAAADRAVDRCEQLGALSELVDQLGARLSATARRFAERMDQLQRVRGWELWSPADPITALWTVREAERVADDVRADDAAAATHLAVLADGLHGMAKPQYLGWLDHIVPVSAIPWLREHQVLPSVLASDLVAFAAGLPPGMAGTARLRDALYVLPADELAALLEAHPALAARLAADEAVPPVLAAAPRTPAGRERIVAVRSALSVVPEEERQIVALLYPRVIGALDGATVADRITANRVLITAALDAERSRRAEVLARLDRRDSHTGLIDFIRDHADEVWDRVNDSGPIRSVLDDFEGDARAQLVRSDRRIALYRSVLAGQRQVLAFDPRGDGVLVELFGVVDRQTTNVALLVPGTGMTLEAYDGWASIARDFHGQDPNLATIAWLGGDFPDTLSAAAHQSYAEESGPALRDFIAGLDVPPTAAATVLGYSYGGAVVGVAEREGMVVDRVLHVASAGTGAGTDSLADYAGRAGEHYTMTAPGDPITLVRGVEIGPFGHGGDPDELPGFVRLPTGCYGGDHPRAGERISGAAGHADVFSRRSTAWDMMFAIMTGRPPGDIAECRP